MKLLKIFGTPDPTMKIVRRESVRGILMDPDGTLHMVTSSKYGDCCFPGGGIEEGEDHIDALIREVMEETGYAVDPASIKPFGRVDQILHNGFFGANEMHLINYFYLCRGTRVADPTPTENEKNEGVAPVSVTLEEALAMNRALADTDYHWVPRETFVLELLQSGEIPTQLLISARAALARANFMRGYGCAQSVLLAYADLTGLDETTLAKLGSSFGGGMGRLREVCGGVTGAFAVLGLVCGYDDPADKEGKSRHYADIRELARRFTERSRGGSIVCREILKNAGLSGEKGGEAEARTTEYYQKRPCPELVALAAEVLGEMLWEKGILK
ncbi:MAG: C-GCAxxG-C-C family protein [Clostridia bacterium]|nr:C-GCAxxG-C-C family protein [Clostridia bacterium]